MNHPLNFIFNPESVAIIGASHHEDKWGYMMLKGLVECSYKGKIFPINPKEDRILGLKVYRSVLDIEDHIDIALCSVPAEYIKEIIIDSTRKRIKCLVICTAGFAEMGEDGSTLQRETVEIARQGGTRIIGPNCMGIFSSSSNLNLTGLASPPTGNLALVAQSGNLGLAMFYEARRRDIGFSIYVSVGNQADLQFHEYLDYLRGDPGTKAILLYVEALKNGEAFLKTAKEVVKCKPIICFKAGASDAAKRSAFSHTSSLTGDDEIYNGIFRQTGIIRIDNGEELLDIGYGLSHGIVPRGNRVALIGGGGRSRYNAIGCSRKIWSPSPSISQGN